MRSVGNVCLLTSQILHVIPHKTTPSPSTQPDKKHTHTHQKKNWPEHGWVRQHRTILLWNVASIDCQPRIRAHPIQQQWKFHGKHHIYISKVIFLNLKYSYSCVHTDPCLCALLHSPVSCIACCKIHPHTPTSCRTSYFKMQIPCTNK